MPGRPRPSLSDAEWRLMRALWSAHGASNSPVTARDVLDSLEPGTQWAYTTLKTMLERLVDKRVVTRGKRGPVVVYKPRISRAEAEREAVNHLRSGVFGGERSPLVHLLVDSERLSDRDRADLRRILGRLEAEEDEGS